MYPSYYVFCQNLKKTYGDSYLFIYHKNNVNIFSVDTVLFSPIKIKIKVKNNYIFRL